MIQHLLAEQLGRHQRRDVQLQRLAEDFHPAHLGLRRLGLDAREQGRGLGGAPRAGAQAFRALGLLAERLAERRQRLAERSQHLREARLAQRLRPAQAQPLLRKAQAQIARCLVETAGELVELGRGAARRAQLEARVARELDQLRGGERLAEEQPRGLGQLVRLVEDHGVAGGQQLGDALVAQRDVGEKQVMVDHHHVGRERVLARAHHEAVLVVRAFLAEAVFARRRGVLPDRRVLGHVGEVGAVARDRGGGEMLDQPQPRSIVARGEPAFAARPLEPVQAYIIGAALQQRRHRARGDRVAHGRQVAVVELVLQRLGAGRDDHLAAREQRGHQIGEGLAGAGAGFHRERAARFDRGQDRLRHLELLRPRPVAGHLGGERAGGRKDPFQRVLHCGRTKCFMLVIALRRRIH